MKPDVIAQELMKSGRYREALVALTREDRRSDDIATRLLRSELLINIGETERGLAVLETIANSRSIDDSDRSYLEFIRSRASKERGDFGAELQSLQKSISLAERAGSVERLARAQIQLVALVADRSGPDAIGSLMTSLRANTIRLGDSSLIAALHVVAGELDGKRGFFTNALRHTQLAQRLLESSPHLWIDAWSQINTVAIAIAECEFERALPLGEAALKKSAECGSMWATRASMANLGFVHLQLGHFETALQYFDQVVSRAQFENEQAASAIDSMARVCLAQGMLDECRTLFQRFDESFSEAGAGRYVHRHSLLTRSEYLARLRDWPGSLNCLDTAAMLGRQADDQILVTSATLLKTECLLHRGRASECWLLIEEALGAIATPTPDMSACYERALACLLAGTGHMADGERHRERAERIYRNLGNTPALIELSRSWQDAEARGQAIVPPPPDRTPDSKARNLLQNVATLLLHAGRPELLATGLIAVLADCESAYAATALTRAQDGTEETLAAFGTFQPDRPTRTLDMGRSRNRAVEVRLQALPDVESAATLNSATMLLGTVRDLERARAEREERLTLWPIEELPFDAEDAVIMGRMSELMTFARKVAQTNVTVLLTGESGTGKEVLARAIHGYSPRAKKPFVPFNCTAIPRELLESQLFGYRRGAFTGADRDNPGLIRGARDGTLFLDEVGDLGPDLQPKLLRFLESGEIHPLGENAPLHVDVRIVAATNAHLERLVEEGKFREDLFYRLNVICLSIPPLRERRDEIPGLVHHFVAKAAHEFRKGRIRIAEETMERIILYSWPGNIRQLQNELRRMIALADPDSTLTPSAFSKTIRQETMHAMRSGNGPEIAVPLTDKLSPTLSRVEREMIKVALRANDGHLEAAAKALGISRKGLYLKRQRLGV